MYLTKARADGLEIQYLPPYQASSLFRLAELLVVDATDVVEGASQRLAEAVCRQRSIKSPEEAAEIKKVPGQLQDAIAALEADHEFLTEGDVFTPDFIESYIDYKRAVELDAIRLRPHPYEFVLYYDI